MAFDNPSEEVEGGGCATFCLGLESVSPGHTMQQRRRSSGCGGGAGSLAPHAALPTPAPPRFSRTLQVEEKAKELSLHAHKLVKENK